MKRFLKRLMLAVVTLAMVCCVTPLAYAAENYHTIYLEPQGGIGVPTQIYVYKYGDVYRASTLPTPTMEGYTFDGWYEDITGGDAIKASEYDFKTEGQSIYAHWTVASSGTSTAKPAESTAQTKPAFDFKLEDHLGEIVVIGTTVLVVTLVALHG